MNKYSLISFLIFLGCSPKAQECNPNLDKCNLVWEKIYSERSNFSDKICDFFSYEQKKNDFTKEKFIDFLNKNGSNDSLIMLLNQINFKIKIENDKISGLTSLQMLNCVEGKNSCSDSILLKELLLFSEPIENCEKYFKKNQIEVFPFSKGIYVYEQDELVTYLKYNLLKFEFRSKLRLKDELFTEKEINNNERIRRTTFNLKKAKGNKWNSLISSSEHKNQENLNYGKNLILDFLNSSTESKESSIDSLIINVRFYEKDQAKGF